MLNNYSRIVALTAALSFAGLGVAAASTVQLISQHGAQPHSNMLSSAHGMMASQKHNFVATHKASNKKTGLHGFANGQPNAKKKH
jgi:hypothetical protein